jgi:hypothetical protein
MNRNALALDVLKSHQQGLRALLMSCSTQDDDSELLLTLLSSLNRCIKLLGNEYDLYRIGKGTQGTEGSSQ